MTEINVNEQTVDEKNFEENSRYDIVVFPESVEKDSQKVNLKFKDGQGDQRSVTIWASNDQLYDQKDFVEEFKYRFSNIKYDKNGSYHNLTADYKSDLEEIKAPSETESAEKTEEDEIEAHIRDGSTDVQTPSTSKSNHAITTYKSENPLNSFTVHVYSLRAKSGYRPTECQEKRKETYSAIRAIRRRFNEDTEVPMALSGPLEFVSTEKLSDAAVHSHDTEKFKTPSYGGERELDYSDAEDRDVAKRLFEEKIKVQARQEGYLAHSINSILDPDPVQLRGDYDFSIHRKYESGIEIAKDGYVYFHINPRHKFESDLTLDQIADEMITPGLRVTTTYNHRGHRVRYLSSDKARDKTIDNGNQSVVEYHRGNPDVPTPQVDEIEQANRRVVHAAPQGQGKPGDFPQELLALQGHSENLAKFAEGFWNEAQKETRISPNNRISRSKQFIDDLGTIKLQANQISFDTKITGFSGDSNYQVKRLYETDENIIQFGDGHTGAHPKEYNNKNYPAYEPPNSFKLAYIVPEPLKEDDRASKLWNNLSKQLDRLDSSVDEKTEFLYDPTDEASKIAIDVGSKIGRDHDFDAAFMVLPPKEQEDFFSNPYGEIKKSLAENDLPSQMAHIDTFQDNYTHANIALGVLAAAGGIPFTVEDTMPGNTDLFIGIDVTRTYDSEFDNKNGVHIGASTTAIYRDGTILGYTSTQAQTGESLPGDDLRDIIRQVITGFKEEHDELPTHIAIHRDGFMNEDLDEVKELLDELNISYDIVEVRKQAPMRILKYSQTDFETPDKGVAAVSRNEPRAILATFGNPEFLADRGSGTPRPITVERVGGSTDIETLSKQVYLLSQSHIGVQNTTIRLPITTYYADKASEAAANKHLPPTKGLRKGVGYI